MPSLYATAFELMMYGLLVLTARHAWRTGGGWGLVRLLSGVVYGVVLEAATIHQVAAYAYGRFWVMVTPEVPLAIGVGWGVIVYGVRLYTQALALPGWQRAVLNGLLALNIDLAMDVVAIRLGFWDWGQGLDFQYFGVPWGNFWAWFWVVWGFTLVWETGTWRGLGRWLQPWVALGFGLLVVLGTNALFVFYLRPPGVGHRRGSRGTARCVGPGAAQRLLAALARLPPSFGGRRRGRLPRLLLPRGAAFGGFAEAARVAAARAAHAGPGRGALPALAAGRVPGRRLSHIRNTPKWPGS